MASVSGHLIKTFGLKSAQQYADANRLAIEQMRAWIEVLKIDCDFEPKDAYAYCCDRERVQNLEVEAEAARQVGTVRRQRARKRPLALSKQQALFASRIRRNSTRRDIWLAWRGRRRPRVRAFTRTRA